jgi:PBSX family phage terminase large subunit
MSTTNNAAEFDATPAQTIFVDDRRDETGYVGGVGSGKTASGVIRSLRHVTDWNVGATGAIVSPTVPMLRNVIEPELRKWDLLDVPTAEYKRSENRIEYDNGSTIILESANNDRKIERLRGLNLAWAWMDEAAYQPRKVYNVLSDRLRVGDYRNLFATTTPRGFNWVHDVFADPLPDDPAIDLPDGAVYRSPTTTSVLGVSTRANPAHPDDYIARQERQRSGEAYEQEIEGEFVNFEGLVYKWFGSANRIGTDALPDTFDRTVYGLDFGGSVPTALIACRQRGDSWYIVDEFYETRVTDDAIAREAQRMYDEHGRGPIYCDHEPRTIEKLSRDGLNAKKADKAVDEGIRHISGLRDRLYVLQRCQSLIDEFNSYQYKDGGDSDDVLKEQDHALDALRYALFSDETTATAGGATLDL